MKITILTASTKKPLANTQIQLQIRGKDSGFLSIKTDATGLITLDDKYLNQQITSTLGGTQGPWIAAKDGATLMVGSTTGTGATMGSKTTGSKEKQPTSSK